MKEASERESRIDSMKFNESPSSLSTHDESIDKSEKSKLIVEPRFQQAENFDIQMPNEESLNSVQKFEKDTQKNFDLIYDQNDMEQDANLKASLFGNSENVPKRNEIYY